MFFLFIKFNFLWKNGIPVKIKAHLPQHSQHYNNCSVLHPFNLFKKLLVSPLFKKEGRDYALYMRDYRVEIILIPFYMTEFLFTKLQSHNN